MSFWQQRVRFGLVAVEWHSYFFLSALRILAFGLERGLVTVGTFGACLQGRLLGMSSDSG